MAIRFFHDNRAIEVNLFATQTQKNPNVKGVGTKIMERMLADCRASNISYVFLWPLAGAVSFYEQFGFQFFNTSDSKINEYMYLPITQEPSFSSIQQIIHRFRNINF